MVVPSIELNQAVVNRDRNAPAAAGFAGGALPPGLDATGQLLNEAIIAPRDDGVSEAGRLEL